MSVSTILKAKGRDVVTMLASSTLEDVSRELTDKKIGAIVIIGPDGSIEGIVSERDIVSAIAVHGAGAINQPVSAYMTTPVRTCSEQDSVEVLMTIMTGSRFRHLPVEEDGRLSGIVSIGDVVKRRIDEAEMIAKAMQDYISTG